MDFNVKNGMIEIYIHTCGTVSVTCGAYIIDDNGRIVQSIHDFYHRSSASSDTVPGYVESVSIVDLVAKAGRIAIAKLNVMSPVKATLWGLLKNEVNYKSREIGSRFGIDQIVTDEFSEPIPVGFYITEQSIR